jgi:hypothetical protein
MTTVKDWGICQRCKKPAQCGMSYIEIDREGSHSGAFVDGYDICEPCHFEMWDVLRKWFRQTQEGKVTQ